MATGYNARLRNNVFRGSSGAPELPEGASLFAKDLAKKILNLNANMFLVTL